MSSIMIGAVKTYCLIVKFYTAKYFLVKFSAVIFNEPKFLKPLFN